MNMTANATMANQPKNIKEILSEFDSEKRNIEVYFSDAFDNYRNLVENTFLMVQMNLAGSLDTNLYDYIAECCNPVTNSEPSAIKKGTERPTRPVTKTAANRTTRQKSATVATSKIIIATKHRTATRSEDRAPLTENNESKHKTPMNRPPIPSSATVTPKVNMNEPMSMMRRPNQGEVALSMTGSPLMISSVSRDDMATVSVPLANGNILSILPRTGVAMNISFDEQTKNELLLLKGNIEGLLKMNNQL